mmetsp:Transcript_29537/g.84952  ORF Transcript_29537/g.84952 Transcript_29537/m.84952 type:complete len:212 (+) Transcript_29537:899-1534(+)
MCDLRGVEALPPRRDRIEVVEAGVDRRAVAGALACARPRLLSVRELVGVHVLHAAPRAEGPELETVVTGSGRSPPRPRRASCGYRACPAPRASAVEGHHAQLGRIFADVLGEDRRARVHAAPGRRVENLFRRRQRGRERQVDVERVLRRGLGAFGPVDGPASFDRGCLCSLGMHRRRRRRRHHGGGPLEGAVSPRGGRLARAGRKDSESGG